MREPDVCGVLLAFDEFTSQVVIAQHLPGPVGWRPLEDADNTRLREHLQGRCGYAKITKENMRDVLEMVALERRIDSAKTWLESLRWGGVRRVETFLARYMGAADTDYTRAVSRYIWTALAARVMVPGTKADMVPVAIGHQGCRKSSSIAAMVPDAIFFGELDLAKRDDDTARLLQGKLVVELPELRGLRARDADSLKAFISATSDRWVPKYMEHSRTAARRCLFFGSTNESEFLVDMTGARRWLPFEVGRCRPDLIAEDRDQLWAEAAILLVDHGEILQEEAELLAAAEHHKYEVHDPWEALIADYTDNPPTRPPGGFVDMDDPLESPRDPGVRLDWVTIPDLMSKALHLTPNQMGKPNELRIAAILRKLSWERHQTKEKSKIGNRDPRKPVHGWRRREEG